MAIAIGWLVFAALVISKKNNIIIPYMTAVSKALEICIVRGLNGHRRPCR